MATILTELEVKGLEGICDSEFQDGNHPVENPVWSWSANPFTSKRTFSGVMSSLVKKGLAHGDGVGSDEACCYITAAGYLALVHHKA